MMMCLMGRSDQAGRKRLFKPAEEEGDIAKTFIAIELTDQKIKQSLLADRADVRNSSARLLVQWGNS
jgi:hypothetical protein